MGRCLSSCDCSGNRFGLALEVNVNVVDTFVNRISHLLHVPVVAVFFCDEVESSFSQDFLAVVDMVYFGSYLFNED